MRRSIGSATFAVMIVAIAGVLPHEAFAQSHAGDAAASQSLFDEARALTRAGRFYEACPKFEESERLDAGPGTEFNLADCYEHAGRTASAWALFTAVADSLRPLGQPAREKIARDRAAALEHRLARLAVSVAPAARVEGLEVRRDGDLVREAQWGSGVPVDPGKHTIAVTAPGRQPWQQVIDVGAVARSMIVDVPVLTATPVAAPPTPVVAAPVSTEPVPATHAAAPPGTEPSSRSMSGQRIAALVTGALGVVGLGVGGYFGAQAISKHNQYAPLCPNGACSDSSAAQLHDDAATDATLSTATMAIGGAAIVGGVVLWLTAPSSSAAPGTGVRVLPSVGARGGDVSLQGTW